MPNAISSLRQLHEVDREIGKLESQLKEIPLRRRDREQIVLHAQARVDKVSSQIKEVQTRADRGNLDLESNLSEIKKLEVAQNSVKTNADFDRLKTQIESTKVDNERLTEDVLQLMGKVDDLKETRSAKEAQLNEARKEFEAFDGELKRDEKKIRGELEVLVKQRDSALEDIPGNVILTYEKILKTKGNTAMAAVRDQICRECNMTVTTHDLTRILNGSDLVLCRTCSRILYVDESNQR